MIKKLEDLLLVGWREWCALPQFNVPAIKAKLDTGARTSALHAFDIGIHFKRGKPIVKFSIHPLQGNHNLIVSCESPLIDERWVMSSNGQREHRYVIATEITIGPRTQRIELTLSNRDPLKFRMLLGREALKNLVAIDPARSFCQGHIKRSVLKKRYKLY